MIEVLVLATCIGDFACDRALKAYYYDKPHIKYLKKKAKEKLIYHTGEWIVYAAPATALALENKAYNIKINRNFSCNFNSNSINLNMRWDY